MPAEYDYAAAMRRRREAAARMEPLADGTRDPEFDTPRYGPRAGIPPWWRDTRPKYQQWGLTEAQARTYANVLVAQDWTTWEVAELLGVQPRECTCCPLHGRHRTRVQSEPSYFQEAA